MIYKVYFAQNKDIKMITTILIWLLPIFSGLLDAGSRGVIKLAKAPEYPLLAIGFLIGLPFWGTWLLYTGIPAIQPSFWFAVALHVPLMLIAFTLMVRAHRASPLILTAPYLALTPAFLLITSPLMGGGSPTTWGIVGVLIITAGVYVLNIKDGEAKLLEPFKQLSKERGSRLMLIVAALFAITANLDLVALQGANIPFYLLIDNAFIGLSYVFLMVFTKALSNNDGKSDEKLLSGKNVIAFGLFGGMFAFSLVFAFLALSFVPIVPYVIAGKRAGVILFSVIFGFVIAKTKKFGNHDEEIQHLKYRIPGVLAMALGMVIIIFLGQ